MKKDGIELKDFKEELSFLFETIYNELEEYELTPKELIFIFLGIHTIILRAAFCNYEKETLNSFIYGKFNFSSDIEKLIGEMNNMGDLAPDLNKYQLAYLFKYLGDNNHLGNITNKYLSKYKYPQWNFSETFGFEESIKDISFFNRLFPDMITERLKNDSSSFGWTLRTYKDSKIIIDDAAFVWPLNEGTYRFITKNGNWGFILDYTFEVIYLPKNIIQMEDFHCLRSRVLMCKEDVVAFEIDDNNKIFEDANPIDLHWGYIDMRGNVVSTEKYVFATDYDDFIATVSKSSLGWDWSPNYGVKSPYNRYQVDVFGQLTDESRGKIEEAFEEVEKRKRIAWWNENINNDVDEDDIMRALQNGYGDTLGY